MLEPNDGADLVVDDEYKRELLSIITHMFDQLQRLLRSRSSQKEYFRTYEGFNAQMGKVNSLG